LKIEYQKLLEVLYDHMITLTDNMKHDEPHPFLKPLSIHHQPNREFQHTSIALHAL